MVDYESLGTCATGPQWVNLRTRFFFFFCFTFCLDFRECYVHNIFITLSQQIISDKLLLVII